MQPTQEKYKYEYNGKEFQGEFSLNWNDYGARNYDASLGRWVNLDALAEKYAPTSAYTYALNNPVILMDPDGNRIKIGKNYYEYKKDRDYSKIKNEFERDTYMALDKLYSTGAMKIDFGEDIGEIDVLKTLVDAKDFDITIVQTEKGHQYDNSKIAFNNKLGVVTATKPGISNDILKEVAKTGKLVNGTGFNSPMAQLGHELIHGFNHHYDASIPIKDKNGFLVGFKKGGYQSRRRDTSTRSSDPNTPYYFNAEEKRTTILSNQINAALDEAIRFDHRGADYKTNSPISTKPIKP